MAVAPPVRQPDLTERLWKLAGEAAYICILAILWLVCSLPIITIGAATVGVYATLLSHIVDGNREYARPFFAAFAANFKSATMVWALQLVGIGLFALNAWFYLARPAPSIMNIALGAAQLLLLAAVLTWCAYSAALISRNALSPGQTIRDSLRNLVANPGWSALIAIITIGVPAALIATRIWAFLPFFPATVMMANAHLLARISEIRRPGNQ
jgi:hypothetical protein